MVSFILPGNSATGGFDVANSLRFDDGSSDHLTRSLGASETSTQKGTFSFWVKRGQLTTAQIIYTNEVANDNNRGFIQFEDDDTFRIKDTVSGSNTTLYATSQLFRDTSAWYHMVVALDSTASAGERITIFKNGTRIPDSQFGTSTEPSQNANFNILTGGQTNKNHIGKIHGGSTHFDGYLAEFVYCDGQVLDADSFGEFDEDSGIWKPIDVSGLTFGNNGFYLDFENSGSLGADVSGNGNNFTVNNLTSIDQTTDTCTNNFCTLNPLFAPPTNPPTYSDGNLTSITDGATAEYGWGGATSIGVSSGKWYCEAKWTQGGAYSRGSIGVTYDPSMSAYRNGSNSASGSYAYGWGYRSYDGVLLNNGSTIWTGNTYATGDIIGIYLDLDNHKLYISKNGVLENSGTGANLTTGETYHIYQEDVTGTSSTSKFEFNFGNPTYTISSGNSDPNSYGNFEYSTTITGDSISKDFYALNTKNLAEYG